MGSSVDTVPSAMQQAFDFTLTRTPPDPLQWLLQAVMSPSEEAVRKALKDYVLPLFDGSRGRTFSILCPSKSKRVIEAGLQSLDPPFSFVTLNVRELSHVG